MPAGDIRDRPERLAAAASIQRSALQLNQMQSIGPGGEGMSPPAQRVDNLATEALKFLLASKDEQAYAQLAFLSCSPVFVSLGRQPLESNIARNEEMWAAIKASPAEKDAVKTTVVKALIKSARVAIEANKKDPAVLDAINELRDQRIRDSQCSCGQSQHGPNG